MFNLILSITIFFINLSCEFMTPQGVLISILPALVTLIKSDLPRVTDRIFMVAVGRLLCEGGLGRTRHTSVSSDMTSSGLHLSRQQFFPLIHSCNEISQATANPRSPILGFGSCPCSLRKYDKWLSEAHL